MASMDDDHSSTSASLGFEDEDVLANMMEIDEPQATVGPPSAFMDFYSGVDPHLPRYLKWPHIVWGTLKAMHLLKPSKEVSPKYIIAEACAGAGTASYCMDRLCFPFGFDYNINSFSERCPMKRNWLSTHFAGRVDHIFAEMLDGHGDSRIPCDLHPHTAHGCCMEKPNQDIDIFVFGPPCRPYTVFSSCRKDADYNPLQAKDSQPFVKGSRWIRDHQPRIAVMEEVLGIYDTFNGLNNQLDPDFADYKDESGVEGVAVKQRPEGQKLLVVGKRFSAESIRQQLHDGKDDQASAFARQQAKMLEVNGVDQETMERNIRQAGEDDSDSSSSSSSEDDSSTESGFGFKKAPKKGKAKAKAGRKKPPQERKVKNEDPAEVAEADAAPATTAPSEKTAVSSAVGVSEKALSPTHLLDKANASLKGLQQLTPWSLYQGVKAKELDAKMSRSLDIVSKLENAPHDASLKELSEKLTGEVNRVSQQGELFTSLASPSELASVLQSRAGTIAEMVQNWKQEESNSFMTDLCKRIIDLLVSSEGKEPLFFQFVALKEEIPKDGTFTLNNLKSIISVEQDALQNIALFQQNSFNYFIDRLRGVPPNIMPAILDVIPKAWYFPELCRTPIPASAPLTWSPLDTNLSNATGVVTKALVDLQRFLACAMASLPQVDNDMKTGFKTIVGATSVSARVSLVIKSNPTLRTLWQKVVDLAKEALDCKAALLKASEMTGALLSLEKAIVAKETPCSWKWTAVAPVNDILGLLLGHDTLTDEQTILVTKLQDAKTSICQQAPSWETMVPELEEFLKKQWLSSRVGELPRFFKLTEGDNIKDMLKMSASAGLMNLHILKDVGPEIAVLVAEVAQSLLEYIDTLETSKELPVFVALTLWQKVHPKLLSATPFPPGLPLTHTIIAVVGEAMKRLEEQLSVAIHQHIKAMVCDMDMNVVLKELSKQFSGSAAFPDAISEMLNALRGCDAFKNSQVFVENIKDDQESLTLHLPVYVKLRGLPSSFLEDVCKTEWDRMQAFITTFAETLLSWIEGRSKFMSSASKDFQIFRQVLPAMESWELDPVMWIFEAEGEEQSQIEGKLNKLLEQRTLSGKSTTLLKALVGCHSAMGAEHLWGGHLVKDLLTEMEDFRKDVAKTVAVLTIAPLVVNHEKYKDNPSQYHAKAMQFAATLAISRHDLPSILHQKLDNWLATGNPDIKEEDKKPKAPKRKGEGEDAEKAKKPRASTSERKRKK